MAGKSAARIVLHRTAVRMCYPQSVIKGRRIRTNPSPIQFRSLHETRLELLHVGTPRELRLNSTPKSLQILALPLSVSR